MQGSKMQQPYIGKLCHNCRYGYWEAPSNGQEWHVECSACGAFLIVYHPMPHQAAFHRDKHKYRMFAGGGKPHSRLKTSQIRGNSKGITPMTIPSQA